MTFDHKLETNDLASTSLDTVESPAAMNRRDLLKGSGAILLASFAVPMTGRFSPAEAGAPFPIDEWAYITIKPDVSGDIFTIFVGQTEMGQGIMTGLAQILAEEVSIPFGQIRVEHGVTSNYLDAGTCQSYNSPLVNYGSRLTGGSTSMRAWYGPLRDAGAMIREKLRAAAAAKWSVAVTDVGLANGIATNNRNVSLTLPYSSLAVDASKVTLATPPVPNGTMNIVGKSMPRVDIPAKVNGTAVFGIDVNQFNTPRLNTLAGQGKKLLFAAVQHCSTLGGYLPSTTTPATPTGAVAAVNLGNAVAVVANDTWTAMKLADAMKPSWTIPTSFTTSNGLTYTTSQIDSTYIRNSSLALLTSATPTNLQVLETIGTPGSVTGAFSIDLQYECPHMAHACMEPLNCTVYVDTTNMKCEIWAPAQSPSSVVETALVVLSASGLKTSAGLAWTWSRSDITVYTTYLGGGLGRKIEQDYISQAVRIAISAKVIGKPVKLTWTRVQDFKNDRYRPAAYFRVKASMDKGATALSSLVFRNVGSSITRQNKYSTTSTAPDAKNPKDNGAVAGVLGSTLKYAMTTKLVEFVPNNVGVPLGYWRSVGESYNVFAIESALDELARASGETDMLAFRRKLMPDSRAIAVLDDVAKLSNWSVALPAGNARGVAFMASFGSYIALVAEVSETVNATTLVKTIKVNKIYCSIDCGIPVNPDSIEAQIQGGIIHGLGATLWGQATFTAGKSNLTNFNSYRVPKLKDMPVISVHVMPSTAAVGGVGETAVPVVAPAIANAYAALNGTRIRKLPFYPGSTMGGL